MPITFPHPSYGPNRTWGIRGKANTIPGPSRTAFRDDSEHDSGMMSNKDSDGKPNTFRAVSEWVFDIIPECFPQA